MTCPLDNFDVVWNCCISIELLTAQLVSVLFFKEKLVNVYWIFFSQLDNINWIFWDGHLPCILLVLFVDNMIKSWQPHWHCCFHYQDTILVWILTDVTKLLTGLPSCPFFSLVNSLRSFHFSSLGSQLLDMCIFAVLSFENSIHLSEQVYCSHSSGLWRFWRIHVQRKIES